VGADGVFGKKSRIFVRNGRVLSCAASGDVTAGRHVTLDGSEEPAERPVEDAARSGLGGKTFFEGVERSIERFDVELNLAAGPPPTLREAEV
jgi:hypothetical protein